MRKLVGLVAVIFALAVGARGETAVRFYLEHYRSRACFENELEHHVSFGVKLLSAVSDEGRGNALVSPLGIGTVLSMMTPGAKEPVRRSIREMLGVGIESPGNDLAELVACQLLNVSHLATASMLNDKHVELQFASWAFADQRLDLFPSYSASFRHWRYDGLGFNHFNPGVERLDFADSGSAERINTRVSDATDGAIPRLVSQTKPDAVLMLVNAMRFQGEWVRRFDPKRTVPASFHMRSGEAPKVSTMHADELPARYREDGSFQAIALPYSYRAFELVVVLPRAGIKPREALRRLEFDPSWLGGEGFEPSRGSLTLPRVTLNGDASLLSVLREMGLESALEDTQAFAGIAAPPPMLSGVLHRTMLVLDERGTKAAAATVADMTTRTAVIEQDRFDMRVDRPFALALRYPHGVLFMAWVDDPR